ncbi:S8 family serine peptidase, partial [bacterium]|nr:S8 family serine peptidase [bacterium]
SLSPRALARRAKAAPGAAALVDDHDLPLDAARLAACRATGARLVHRSRWLNAASFRATPGQVRALADLAGVRAVTLVGGARHAAVPRPVATPQPLPRLGSAPAKTDAAFDYGNNLAAMQQINVPAAHAMGLTGADVVVGVLDTGFRVTHEALAPLTVLAAWDFVDGDGVVDAEPGDLATIRNHGTMVLSALAGNMPGQLVGPAPGIAVLLARTEDLAQEVPAEEDNWVAGLEWAEGLGADLISSSLGYVDWYDAADLDGDTAVTTIAADLAAARGLLVVTAAGNDRATTGHLIAPADADSALTVGAVDLAGNTASFSSPGPTADGRIKPDVAALGVSNPLVDPNNDGNYITASGTSFATPVTSGVAALVLERVPALTPLQVIAALRATADQALAPDNDQGWGIIDAAAAVTWFGPVLAHDPLSATTALTTPLAVTAVITDRLGLDTGNLFVNYRVDEGAWQQVPLAAAGEPDTWTAAIPGQPWTATVDYYLSAGSTNGVVASLPFRGAAAPWRYFVTGSSGSDDDLPSRTVLRAPVPNPFNPRTTLAFDLARPGRVGVHIFDLQGRLVRTLLDERRDAGPQAVVWDGRDDAGRAVASGSYLARLTAPDAVRRQKMQLVR